MKHDAIVEQGIPIHERIPIPDEMIPEDSRVEIDAKIQAGYCESPCGLAEAAAFAGAFASPGSHPEFPDSELMNTAAVTTGNVLSMEELANVKGRGWEDIDVSGTMTT